MACPTVTTMCNGPIHKGHNGMQSAPSLTHPTSTWTELSSTGTCCIVLGVASYCAPRSARTTSYSLCEDRPQHVMRPVRAVPM
jgi:hypothetical protein